MTKKIDITLDKERTLAFPIMSLIRLKKEHGIELKDLADEKKSQDMETILALIWAGLVHEDRDLTLEDVGYMVDITMLPEVSEKLSGIFKGLAEKN